MGEFTLIVGKSVDGLALGMDKVDDTENFGTFTPNYMGEKMQLVTMFLAESAATMLQIGGGDKLEDFTHLTFTTASGVSVELIWADGLGLYLSADGAFYNYLQNRFYDVVPMKLTDANQDPVTLNAMPNLELGLTDNAAPSPDEEPKKKKKKSKSKES